MASKIIVGLIHEKRELWKCGSGRNLHKALQKDFEKHNIKIGRDKFFDILRENNLLIKSKRTRTKTTCSYHHFNKYDNLVKDFTAVRSNQVWATDITYIWLKPQYLPADKAGKFCYLSTIIDVYSRKIVGHCVHQDLSVNGCIEALQQALKQRKNKTEELIHHSDRGVQYCCHAYVNLLQKNNVQISMTQTGDPLENAIAERIHKTIKEEFTTDRQLYFNNVEDAKIEVKKYIEFYNSERPHRSIDWLTPNEAHQKTGILKRHWKTYYPKTRKEDLVEA
jgi:putative transposase